MFETSGVVFEALELLKLKSPAFMRMPRLIAHRTNMSAVTLTDIHKTALRLSASGFCRKFSKYLNIM